MGSLLLQPGALFATDFKIVSRLADGGMGSLYVVEQQSTGKRRALKLVKPELVQSPELRRRFEREAKVGACIDSDHVVEVIGAGFDADAGVPWLVMELLEGETLGAYVERRGSLPSGEVRTIFEQLCHALGAAHREGIIHRDLKPENIFLARSRSPNVPYSVKVLDFGIAKVIAEVQTALTGALGTPLWMAPEQTASGASASPATDCWALGLIAFYALTGRCFWLAARSDQSTPMMVLRELLMEEIPPASARAAALGGSVPAGFDGWFARSVNRSQADRFCNATEAFASLAALLGVATAPAASFEAPATSDRACLPAPTVVGTPRPLQTTDVGGLITPHPAAAPAARRWLAAGLGGLVVAIVGVVVIYVATRSKEQNPTAQASLPPPPPKSASAQSSAPVDARRAALRIFGQRDVRVRLDGQPKGKTPLSSVGEVPGSHRLEFDAGERYASESRTIELRPGEIVDLEVKLKVVKGALSVSTKLAGIRLRLRPKEPGRPEKELALEVGAPLVLNIPADEGWTLVARKPGYRDLVRPLVFADGEAEIAVDVALEALPPPEPPSLPCIPSKDPLSPCG